MKTYGILGYPLGHSLSPQIHERLFALSDIKADYKIFEIPLIFLADIALEVLKRRC